MGVSQTQWAEPVPAADGNGQAPVRPGHRPDLALTAAPVVTLAVMLWGISAPSYWKDEADTVSAVSRSLPQLIRLLGHVDAVHGTYYLLLWPAARVAGTGEFATRLPSALAMAAAAVGVVAIARRLGSSRAGLYAGLVFAALPVVSMQGHDARPYGMVTAAAVLASYLLVRAVDDPRPRWFTVYGCSLVLLGYLHLFGLLLVPAHAIALSGLRQRARRLEGTVSPGPGRAFPADPLIRRWLWTVTAAAIPLVPLLAIGWAQRGQIWWIPRPGWHDAIVLITSLGGGPAACAALVWLLGALGGTRERRLTWLAAPWLVLPPAILLAVSEIRPIYYFLYVVFCLPAVALLAGAGLAALGWPTRAAVLALIVALVLPAQLAMRVPGSGGPLRDAAQVLATYERPGDAVIYPVNGLPPWYLAYPKGFGQLRDIGLRQTGAAAGQLHGAGVQPAVLKRRECGARRIWVIEMGPHWLDPAAALVPGFRLVGEWTPHSGAMRLWLYRRAGPVPRVCPAPSAVSQQG
jgi:mannosyltransferase